MKYSHFFESSNLMDCDQESPDSSAGASMTFQKKDKTCLVCGDKALGYNFNAVSCESCKAFFRRNAHKVIRGRCEGRCDITVESRSFCKKCRLAKCFTVGMRKDMILNDEQKQVRKQKIIINKLRKHGQLPPEDTYAASHQDVNDSLQDRIRSQNLHNLRMSFPNLSDKELDVLMKMKSEPYTESKDPSANIKYPSWSESQGIVAEILSNLPEIDQCILNELRIAHEQSSFLANTSTSLKAPPTNATEFVNLAEGFVRRIIKVAKNIEFFKMICKEDQIALLKGSVVEIMMLRSAINYNVQTESWSFNTMKCLSKPPGPSTSSESGSEGSTTGGSTPTESQDGPFSKGTGMQMGVSQSGEEMKKLREMMGSRVKEGGVEMGTDVGTVSASILKAGGSETYNMFLTYSKFIKSLMRTIHGDLLALKLLIMLSLFSADRQGVVEHDKIQQIQECYAGILQKYVQRRFPEDKITFAKIVMKLTDLRNINEVHTKMLLKMKVDSIEPLLIEIFDLPNE
uniref:Nuclear receptor subfamily 1 group I member 2-like isoform X4 n=1 Tax=Crassostrea virginica TaxID=6565 RepID=A0A8B8D769_CRAVI|nr:nuclear receptor subfamily 1 group I member 2-like isoform X4 [Crassostrea virginica]